MYKYFPTNYVWNLSVNLAIEMGARMGEIEQMCAPLLEAAKAPDAAGTAAFRETWVGMADRLCELAAEDEAKGRLLSAGEKYRRASGYLIKRSAASELLTAIREVMRGRSYVTPLVTEGLVESLIQTDGHKSPHELTPRQREVLQLLAEGRSMKEVASLLKLTPRTVAFHKYRMMEQLHVKSTAELIQYAVRHHIV